MMNPLDLNQGLKNLKIFVLGIHLKKRTKKKKKVSDTIAKSKTEQKVDAVVSGSSGSRLRCRAVTYEEFANFQLVRLWCLVENIKTEYMKLMRDNFKCECYLGGDYVDGEGYVMTGKHGTYKLSLIHI